jgi:hypothetical protein
MDFLSRSFDVEKLQEEHLTRARKPLFPMKQYGKGVKQLSTRGPPRGSRSK